MIPGVTFLEPWVLATLVLLPLLWRFLRVTPPTPKRIFFPALFLLKGLDSKENTPAAMPPWLIILRILAVMLLILGLAHPIFNSGKSQHQAAPILIMLFDNSWSSGRNWQQRLDAAHDALDQAERDQQNIILLTTATDTRENPTRHGNRLLAANDARARLDSLSPQPWEGDTQILEAVLSSPQLKEITSATARILWLHSGISGSADTAIANRLQELGNLEIILPTAQDVAVIVPDKESATGKNKPPDAGEENSRKNTRQTSTQSRITAQIISAEPAPIKRFSVAAIDGSNRTVARLDTVIPAGETQGKAVFDLPHPLAQRVTALRVEGQNTAAGLLLLDEQWKRRIVALVGQPERKERPLIDEIYYLERALSFKHDIIRQPFDQSIEGPATTIILTDEFQPTAAQSGMLADWVKEGGLLIRFSGPHLSKEESSLLLPIRPRRGERTLGGALSWDQPMALGSFDSEGPFSQLVPPDDVVIHRQILAEPTATDPDSKIWARLADGTPLVTARRLGKGWTVLFHITAGADWSNLPLSGVFVEMLSQLTGLSGGSDLRDNTRPLTPWRSLDGWGRLTIPPVEALPLDSAAENGLNITIGPTHPPGYYGDKTARQAVNLGPSLAPLAPASRFPEGTTIRELAIGDTQQISNDDLKATLLSLTLLLLCLDTLITLYLRGFLTSAPWLGIRRPIIKTWRKKALLAWMICFLIPGVAVSAHAQSTKPMENPVNQEAAQSTLSTRLAFMETGDPDIDRLSHDGLKGLSTIINQRSSVKLSDPVGVNPDVDDLSFFPLIYWPMTDPFPDLSPQAIDTLNRFMALGGTLIFDAQDGAKGDDFSRSRGAVAALRNLADHLKFPPLVPLPANHVLNRSFYLIDEAPGRWSEGTTWVQEGTGNVNDNISPVIVGSVDWAAAWALDNNGYPLYSLSPGGKRQREQAYRFGVNLVMYILTGNYKSDQVHVPAILERLGQ